MKLAESVLDQDAAIIMIGSMVPAMTTSQLHTLFCCGLATIDAGMLPLYESIGVEQLDISDSKYHKNG